MWLNKQWPYNMKYGHNNKAIYKTTFFVFYSSDVYAVRNFVDSAMDVFIVHVCFKPQTGQTKIKKSLYVNFSSLHNFESMANSFK